MDNTEEAFEWVDRGPNGIFRGVLKILQECLHTDGCGLFRLAGNVLIHVLREPDIRVAYDFSDDFGAALLGQLAGVLEVVKRCLGTSAAATRK